jgi:hypothetical protein
MGLVKFPYDQGLRTLHYCSKGAKYSGFRTSEVWDSRMFELHNTPILSKETY